MPMNIPNYTFSLFLEEDQPDTDLLTPDLQMSFFKISMEYDNIIPSMVLQVKCSDLRYLELSKRTFVPLTLKIDSNAYPVSQTELQSITKTYRVLLTNLTIDNTPDYVTYGFYMISDFSDYMSDGKIRGFNGTSIDVLMSLCREYSTTDPITSSEVKCKLSLDDVFFMKDKIYSSKPPDESLAKIITVYKENFNWSDLDPVNQDTARSDIDNDTDRMNWVQYNIPDKEFVTHVLDHSYVKDDMYLCNLTLQNKLIIIQLIEYLKSYKQDLLCFYDGTIPDISMMPFKVCHKSTISYSNYNSMHSFVSSRRNAQHVEFINNKTSRVEYESLVPDTTLLGRRGFSGTYLDNGNCHPRYYEALTENVRNKAFLENYTVTISTDRIYDIEGVPVFTPFYIIPRNIIAADKSNDGIPVDKLRTCLALRVDIYINDSGKLNTTIQGSILDSSWSKMNDIDIINVYKLLGQSSTSAGLGSANQ
ncbi:hypothetical protein C3I27_03355 [Campylobacter jejuni]|uniref:Uncharacterized protein n=1 Tax=Campylobacter jejuni TaxID=197 RepID=A0A431EEA0_CAMJU|nr:hypothetical protein [Campylobacter jejuni]RTI48463.1 hypothetical protein C3I27_03355 [Campylobacter jejuni]RTJ79570.1 hypothetical protein C3H57_04165 [Campylobacter jejuni]HEG8090886.1 hypothetical protein [Campylobacter jejuni]HEG8097799.1 hypothetical protein [Campylobacter jejuni]HEG8104604.1 hypothetical protein [Campylobacter jejuni]